jgi:hypothetical protein
MWDLKKISAKNRLNYMLPFNLITLPKKGKETS